MSALQLRRVSKIYGRGASEVHALIDVDLSVDPGELVAVMGPSGSGKSTLLTIAGSLEEPSGGEVTVGDVPLSRLSRNERAALRRRVIGYVFQDFNLLAGLTAAENVSLPLELDGTSGKAARAAALEALDQLGLPDQADRFPDELSGGERQRVAIARAVVGQRRLLLADEPSGALDSVNGESVMRLVRASCQGGVAGVVVTHDAQLAAWPTGWCSCATGGLWTRPPSKRVRSRCWKPARRDDQHPGAATPARFRDAAGPRWASRGAPGHIAVGLAAASPRVAPAIPRTRPARRSGRIDHRRAWAGRERAELRTSPRRDGQYPDRHRRSGPASGR